MVNSLRDFLDKEYWNDGYNAGKAEQLANTIVLINEMEISENIKEEIIRILNENFYE